MKVYGTFKFLNLDSKNNCSNKAQPAALHSKKHGCTAFWQQGHAAGQLATPSRIQNDSSRNLKKRLKWAELKKNDHWMARRDVSEPANPSVRDASEPADTLSAWDPLTPQLKYPGSGLRGSESESPELMCTSLLSFALVNTMIENNLRRKGFI